MRIEAQLPPRVSQSIPPSLACIPLEPPAPSLLEDFISKRVSQVTYFIVDRVCQVANIAAAKSLSTFEKASRSTFERAFQEGSETDCDPTPVQEQEQGRRPLRQILSSSSSRDTVLRISSPRHPSLPPAPSNMTTFVKEIKVKNLVKFNGTPADLKSFHASVKRCLTAQNLPLYYGSWVLGEPDGDYQYIAPNTPNSKSNYHMSKCLCAFIAEKFDGMALTWWDDYDAVDDNPVLNC